MWVVVAAFGVDYGDLGREFGTVHFAPAYQRRQVVLLLACEEVAPLGHLLPAETAGGVSAHLIEGILPLHQPLHPHYIRRVEDGKAGQREALRGKGDFVRAPQSVENVQGAAAGRCRLLLQHQPAERVRQPTGMPLAVAPRVVEAPPPVRHSGGWIPVPTLNRGDDQQVGQLASVGQERDPADACTEGIDSCAFADTGHADENQHRYVDDGDPAGWRAANAETICQQFKFSVHPGLAFWTYFRSVTAIRAAVAHKAPLYASCKAAGN